MKALFLYLLHAINISVGIWGLISVIIEALGIFSCIIIIIIPRQCLWCCHYGRSIARVYPVQLMNVERRQAAADPRPSQTTLAVSPPVQAARVYTHHHHFFLLLSTKADTHFTIPWRAEGWVDLVGWLHAEMVYLPQTVTRLGTNQVWCMHNYIDWGQCVTIKPNCMSTLNMWMMSAKENT